MENQNAKDIAVLNERVNQHDDILGTMVEDIKEIKDALLGRPSWLITSVISALLFIIGILINLVKTKL